MSICSNCGHEKGTGVYCGGCGQRSGPSNAPTQPQYQQPQYGSPQYVPNSAKTNSLAIASLVVSLICCAPLGVIFGHIAIGQIKKTGEGGRGLAIAGLIIGYIGIVGGLLFWIIAVAASSSSGY